MSITRRDFAWWSAVGLAAAACGGRKPSPTTTTTPQVSVPKKKILILGGTGFIGPKTIAAAVARGHTVTIFNRGKREKYLPLEIEVEHLYGNRDPDLPADDEKGPDGKLVHPDASPKGLEQLVGRKWDVVIDNSGYYPRMVAASAKLLADNASQYIYISSISAFDEEATPANGADETAKLATMTADPAIEEMGAEFEKYGPFKVLCEQAAEAAFPGRATIVRPGYIVGPGDPTDRFSYWPVRVARGGDMLVPGAASDPLQWVDVRDLADFLVTLAEHGTTGAFNAVGPTPPAAWGDVIAACVEAAGTTAAKLEWVPATWLDASKLEGADQFPIWIAPVGKYAGFHRWNNARAVAAGLPSRPVKDTVKAILEWYPTEIERRVKVTAEMSEAAKAAGKDPPPLGDPGALRAGPTPEQEQVMLAKWRASGAKPTK